jgi:hypothetical protein
MPGYDGASSENESSQQDKDHRITITGTLCFTYELGAAATQRHRDDYLATMTRRGYKVGVRIKRDQRLERLSFAGQGGEVVLVPSDQVTRELEEALPCPDEQWIGLLPPKDGVRRYTFRDDPRRLVICYTFTLVVLNVRCLPQPVPIVLTYGDERFAQHYLLHLMVLSDRRGLRVTTEAVR